LREARSYGSLVFSLVAFAGVTHTDEKPASECVWVRIGLIGQVSPVATADSDDEQCEDSETDAGEKRHAD
jgi:hypothetical protein